MYHGESTHCTVTLTNIGQVPIEMLEVEINSILDPTLQDQIFRWDNEEVKRQLPIQPNESATINLYLHAAANFLAPNVPMSPSIQPDMSSGVFSSMSTSLPPGGSLPSRFNSSFRSSNSGQSSIAGGLTALFQQQPTASAIEGQLRLRYSGSSGLEADYCRICSVFFMLEMMPSLHVTNWDVLPAET